MKALVKGLFALVYHFTSSKMYIYTYVHMYGTAYYYFIFTCVYKSGNTIQFKIIPLHACMDHVFLWHGTYTSLILCHAWNTMHGIALPGTRISGMSMHTIATVRIAWNTCGTHMQLTCLIQLTKHIKLSPQL